MRDLVAVNGRYGHGSPGRIDFRMLSPIFLSVSNTDLLSNRDGRNRQEV
jgi:hypothetical protein